MKRVSLVFAVLSCVVLIIACVTVNIYFPAGEIQEAADEIVEDVRLEEGEDQGSFLERNGLRVWAILASSLGPDPVFAQGKVDINVSTPAIRALQKSLAQHFKSLKPFYKRGNLGENNKSYLEIHDETGLELKEKAKLRKLVKAENKDRKELYKEILEANDLDNEFLDDVEGLFANSWRKKRVVPGTWIQKDDGTWVQM
jgi:uncharacterized protein YdbL (DUF1318 family)